jgi:formylglycine-generating enzyme required for sulfatase activity
LRRRCLRFATTLLVASLPGMVPAQGTAQETPPSPASPCNTSDIDGTPIVSVAGGETRLRIFLDRHRATLEIPFRLAGFCIHAVPVTRATWYAANGSLPHDSAHANSAVDPNEAPLPSEQQLPVTGVTQQQAASYCASIGGRLPTESEWEFAATANGDLPHTANTLAQLTDTDGQPLANLRWDLDRYDELGPVMAFPAGPYGVYDMIGNAAEWTSSAEVFSLPLWSRLTSRLGNEESNAVFKGGSFADNPDESRRWEPRARAAAARDQRLDDVGFRCVFSAATLQN